MSQCIIVIPCYNEARRLDTRSLMAWSVGHRDTAFLLIDDGSTDDTRQILDGLVTSAPDLFSAHYLPHNVGKAEAVRIGMLLALEKACSMVGFWDADFAAPLNTIAEFQNVLNQNPRLQMVMGSRVRLLGHRVHRKPLRHYIGRVFATLVSLMLDIPVYDTQCGAKLCRATPQLESAFRNRFVSRWIFDVELIARLLTLQPLHNVDDIIHEIPLRDWDEVPGSKVRMLDVFRAGRDLLLIYLRFRGFRPKSAPRRYAAVAEVSADSHPHSFSSPKVL